MKKDGRNFDQVLQGIDNAEKDVDKVLQAAKLQRNERYGFKDWLMEGCNFESAIFGLMVILIVLGLFTMIILSIIF